MTDKEGQVLPECAAQLAVLDANVKMIQEAGRSFSLTAGELRECVASVKSSVASHAVALAEVNTTLTHEVLPVIRGLKPLAIALETKQTKDITRRILTSSTPDDPLEVPQVKAAKVITRERIIQAVIAIILVIASLITGNAVSI